MVYDVYISKLREISNYENPRQVYLDKDFSKTTLYRVLSNEARKEYKWAIKEKLIYKYLGYAAKAHNLQRYIIGGNIYAKCEIEHNYDTSITRNYNYNNRKKTEIANEFYDISSYNIIDDIRGIRI